MRIVSLPCLAAGLCLLAVAHLDATAQAVALETITIDARAAAKPFPHFWERCSARPGRAQHARELS